MSTITVSRTPTQKWLLYSIALGAGALFLSAILGPNLLRNRAAADEARFYSLQHPTSGAAGESNASNEASSVSLSTRSFSAELQAADKAPSAAPASPMAAKASASADRKIVRTGAFELIVKNPADAAEQIRVMAEGMGGYLESGQIGGSKDAPIANITIRVPASHFEDAKAGIRKLAGRVESEKTDAQDVTRANTSTWKPGCAICVLRKRSTSPS